MNKGLLYLISKKPTIFLRDLKKHPGKILGIFLLVIYIMLMPFLFKNLSQKLFINNESGFILIISTLLIYSYLPSYLNVINGKGLNYTKEEINFLFPTPIKPQEIIIYGILKALLMSIAFNIAGFILAYFVCNISFIKSLLYVFLSFILAWFFDTNMFIFFNLTKYKFSLRKWIKYVVIAILSAIIIVLFYYIKKDGLSVWSIKKVLLSDYTLLIPIVGFGISLLKLIILGPKAIYVVFTSIYILLIIFLTLYNKNISSYDIFFEDFINYSNKIEKTKEQKNKKLKKDNVNKKIKTRGARALASKIFIEKSREKNKVLMLILLAVFSIFISYFVFRKYAEFTEIIFMSALFSFYLNGFLFGNTNLNIEMKEDYYYLIPIRPYKKIFYLSLYDIFLIFLRGVFLYIPMFFISKLDIYVLTISFMVFFLFGINSIYASSISYKIIGKNFGNFLALLIFFIIEFIILAIYILVAYILYTNFSELIIGIVLVILNIFINFILIFIIGKLIKYKESLI